MSPGNECFQHVFWDFLDRFQLSHKFYISGLLVHYLDLFQCNHRMIFDQHLKNDINFKSNVYTQFWDTLLTNKHQNIAPCILASFSVLWFLEMWQSNACLVFVNFGHHSQLYPAVGKCMASKWFLAFVYDGESLPQTRHTMLPYTPY